jgi:hypothetical protein
MMRYTVFGRRTGLRVSELALGTGSFGTGWGHGADPAESRRIFDAYAEAGGTALITGASTGIGAAYGDRPFSPWSRSPARAQRPSRLIGASARHSP